MDEDSKGENNYWTLNLEKKVKFNNSKRNRRKRKGERKYMVKLKKWKWRKGKEVLIHLRGTKEENKKSLNKGIKERNG